MLKENQGHQEQPREIRGERDTRSGNFIDHYQLVSKEGAGEREHKWFVRGDC